MAAGNPTKGVPTGISVLYEAARKFMGTCAAHQTKGNLEVRAEAYELAATLGLVADTLALRAEANRKQNINPVIHTQYQNAAAAIHAVAQSMLGLGPTFDATHKGLVDNQFSGQNPAGWDTVNNRR
jgi:hypothetical protein